MTRRYAPRSIDVGHSDTQAAEARREWSRPRQQPQPAPASWEATPEPAPTPQPKPGPPKRIIVRASNEGAVALSSQEVADLNKRITEAVVSAHTPEAQEALRRVRRSLNSTTRSTF